MRKNHLYQQAVSCLAHPLSWIALALLFLNDHLFRVLWPGWWTGKLGDFAWLFVFPFALAALFSWRIPSRVRYGGWWVPGLAFGLTGGIFALVKTCKTFHLALVHTASQLLGWQVNWRLDPSDLVALSSLVGAAWLWRKSFSWKLDNKASTWLLLSITAFLTIANSIGPSEGIYCLEVSEGQVHALSSGGVFVTRTGGLTWETSEKGWIPCQSHFYDDTVVSTLSLDDPIILPDPNTPAVLYRISTGSKIERSSDGGQSWKTEYQPKPPPQAVQAYKAKNNAGTARFKEPPLDAVFDPNSGNLIFAMGFDGVLVRQVDGTYTVAGVGVYQREKPGFGQMLLILFPGEALMALILGGLGVTYLASRKPVPTLHRLGMGGAGLLWMIVAVWIPPALKGHGYEGVFVLTALGVSGLTLLPLMISTKQKTRSSSPPLVNRYLLIFLIGSLLFLLPFIAWVLNILPQYRLAQVLGLTLGCGWIYQQFRRIRTTE